MFGQSWKITRLLVGAALWCYGASGNSIDQAVCNRLLLLSLTFSLVFALRYFVSQYLTRIRRVVGPVLRIDRL